MATEERVTKSFTTTILTPIATSRNRPTYASIKLAQSELNGNAASVHTNLGGGLHGHLALTIPSAKYLTLSNNTAFVPPVNPPPNPVHVAGATAITVNEDNRQHLQQQKDFKTYHDVDKALRNQIIASLPDLYIRAVKDDTTGYGNVTSLTMLDHLWKTYGTITQPELKENEKRMQLPWNPPTPIEVLFTQLDDAVAFAHAGGEDFATTQVIRTGYEIIEANGLFETACREWRQRAPAAKSMQQFHEHFRNADLDRASTTTTGTAGYHSNANHVAETPPHVPFNNTANQAELIAQAVHNQVALAMAALNKNQSTARRDRPDAYCWTHGISKNIQHTSEACENRADGHQAEATKENKMGGSTRIGGRRVNGN
jgi:hypothetical protein